MKWTDRVAELEWLHPYARPMFQELADQLAREFANGRIGMLFVPFETFRTPHRQKYLLQTTPNTKAGPYQSTHQFGLAVDFVPVTRDGKWTWDEHCPWDELDRCVEERGLVRPIRWDRPHVEHRQAKYIMSDIMNVARVSTASLSTGEQHAARPQLDQDEHGRNWIA